MLPTAPLPNTRLTVEDFPQPVRSATQVIDVLSEFIPGQKLIAQIQFQLANGAYRATIAQRDVTLALPFSAKPGDSLELDVVETEGRIAFAVSKTPIPTDDDAAPPQASASTTLSRTGQMIGQLLQDRGTDQQKPAPLNAGEPVLKSPPTSSKELAPALQQAINRSGLFYESHQSAWLQGKLPEAALRQEPQAQLAKNNLQIFPGSAALPVTASPTEITTNSLLTAQTSATLRGIETEAGNLNQAYSAPPPYSNKATSNSLDLANQAEEHGKGLPDPQASNPANTQPLAGRTNAAIPADLAPIVQQQLASLANNVYPFHGAIWPGQQIFWEIVDENGSQGAPDTEDAPRQWKTRLKLLLPSLGDIDATVQLDGKDIVVTMKAGDTDTQLKLKSDVAGLRSRLDLAGLRLMTLEVKGYERDESAG